MANTSSSLVRLRTAVADLYVELATRFGAVRVVWHDTASGPKVLYVALPSEEFPPRQPPWNAMPEAVAGSCAEVAALGMKLKHFLEGEDTTFDLHLVALEGCGEFQRRVLLADNGIPRGSVSTYGRVATVVGSPGAARAVGQALARNPFPLIIPCHRAVRSDRRLGGYRGGLDMKRALLRMEGVEVAPAGKVVLDRYYY